MSFEMVTDWHTAMGHYKLKLFANYIFYNKLYNEV